MADVLRRETLPPRASVLDVETGSGLLAVTAARRGARSVTACDGDRRALWNARLNARWNRVRVRTARLGAEAALGDRRFDVIVSSAAEPAVLDALVARAGDHLRPGGFLLVAASAGPTASFACGALRDAGLDAEVVTSPADVDAQRHGTVVVRGRVRTGRAAWPDAPTALAT